MQTKLLPIGSVVLIGDSVKKVMIIGVAQMEAENEGKIWDYAGVIFPEGYLSADEVYLFDNEQITEVYALGYQDAEQMEFRENAEIALQELRSKE